MTLLAGACTAAAVALLADEAELQRGLAAIDFPGMLSEPALGRWRLMPLGDPSTFLDKGPALLAIAATAGVSGVYKQTPLLGMLKQHVTKGATFKGLTGGTAAGEWWEQRQLKVITSDLSAGRMCVLPDDLGDVYGVDADEFDVAEGVAQSMCLPFFFEAAIQQNARTGAKHTIVDGGVLSGFPLWCAPCGTELSRARVAL